MLEPSTRKLRMPAGEVIAPGPPLAQSTAHQTPRRLLGRSTTREGVFVCKKGLSRSAREKSASAGLAPEVRRWRKVPTPLSIFPTELLSALSPRLRLFIQRVQAQHGRVPLKSERSSTSCFVPPPFIPLALHLPPLWFERFDTPSFPRALFLVAHKGSLLEVIQRVQSWSKQRVGRKP